MNLREALDSPITITLDEYQEVVNSEDTYDGLAKTLLRNGAVIIGWTDRAGTHHDVLLSTPVQKYGYLASGLRVHDLYVSIMRIGAFGFAIRDHELHPSYVMEKLYGKADHVHSTAVALCDLINGIMKRLVVK